MLSPQRGKNPQKKSSPKGRTRSSLKAGPGVPAKLRRRPKFSPVLTLKPRHIFAALGVLALVVLIPYVLHLRGETGAPVPEGRWSYTIDISHHNSSIVWDSLAVCIDGRGRTCRDILKAKRVNNVSQVIIKASEGVSLKDKDFVASWSAAASHGIRRGAYHFFRTSTDPAAQAKNFIDAVGPLSPGDLPPVLDLETIHRGCSSKQLCDNALVWLRAVEKHYGVKPVIYTGDSFLKEHLSPALTDNYPIWIAHYKTSSPIFKDWILWQFTDEAVVRGIRGKVDLSVAPVK